MEENSEARSAYNMEIVHFLSISKWDLPQSSYSTVLVSSIFFSIFFLIVNGNENDEEDSKDDVYTKCKYAFLWNAIYCLLPSTIPKNKLQSVFDGLNKRWYWRMKSRGDV